MQMTNPFFVRNGGGWTQGTAASIATGNGGTANRALLIPAYFPAACTVTAISFRPIAANGNYDLGLYLPSYARIDHKGSTACANADQTFTLTTPLSVTAGSLYYVGLCLSSLSDTFVAQNLGAWVADRIGVMDMASAFPLPDPFVPVAPASAFVPVIRFTISGLPT